MAMETFRRVSTGWKSMSDGRLISAQNDHGYVEGWGTPTWRDEFDTPTLDASKWVAQGPWSIGTDTDGYLQPENVVIEDGKCILRGRKLPTPISGRTWGSAEIRTQGKFSFRYGRIEVRVKALPPLHSKGMWPAFWIRDNQGGGENDIWETVGTPALMSQYNNNGSSFSCTFYKQTGVGTVGVDRTATVFYATQAPYYDFHTFAMEWTPTRMTNYCDGVKTGEILDSDPLGHTILSQGFTSPTGAYMRLTLQIGSNWGGHPDDTTDNPNDIEWDYVRYWPYNGQA